MNWIILRITFSLHLLLKKKAKGDELRCGPANQEGLNLLEVPYLPWPVFSQYASLVLLYPKDEFSTVFPQKCELEREGAENEPCACAFKVIFLFS